MTEDIFTVYVQGRELWKFVRGPGQYTQWISRIFHAGFLKRDVDYIETKSYRSNAKSTNGGKVLDHLFTLEATKKICEHIRGEEAKELKEYLDSL